MVKKEGCRSGEVKKVQKEIRPQNYPDSYGQDTTLLSFLKWLYSSNVEQNTVFDKCPDIT